MSLELGGSNDIANLYPESYAGPNGARVKDALENDGVGARAERVVIEVL